MIFQIIGCTVLILFYACYFLKSMFQRKQGIKTNQIGKGKSGAEKNIEIFMGIATFLQPVTAVISIIFNIYTLPVWVRIVGVIFSVLGLVFFVISVVTMKNNWRAGVSYTDDTKLVTTGIYKISRNPAFLGFDLVYLGLTMMFFNWILFLISMFAVVMFHLQIVNVEEDFLISTFGNDYLNYKATTNRYIGYKRTNKKK